MTKLSLTCSMGLKKASHVSYCRWNKVLMTLKACRPTSLLLALQRNNNICAPTKLIYPQIVVARCPNDILILEGSLESVEHSWGWSPRKARKNAPSRNRNSRHLRTRLGSSRSSASLLTGSDPTMRLVGLSCTPTRIRRSFAISLPRRCCRRLRSRSIRPPELFYRLIFTSPTLPVWQTAYFLALAQQFVGLLDIRLFWHKS